MANDSLGLFITGTDTGVGKTTVSALLLSALQQNQIPSSYFKPIQTGTESDTETVRSLTGILKTSTSLKMSTAPLPEPVYSFPEPIAPHRAAALNGVQIAMDKIASRWTELQMQEKPLTWIVEGAGGLLVPLNQHQSFRELVQELRLPVLVVASTRLGTLNHTILTLEAAQKRNLHVTGIAWVGDEDPTLETSFQAVLENMGLASVLQLRIPSLKIVCPTAIQELAPTVFPSHVIQSLFAKFSGPSSVNSLLGSSPAQSSLAESSLSKKDRQFVWHPYSQHGLAPTILPVRAARGAYLELEDGQRLLDGISSWWVNLHGHGHPRIADAIHRQAIQMEHLIFAGFTHEPAAHLSELLITETAKRRAEFTKVFFSDNGSTAVEVALKMAYQYHYNQGSRTRTRFLALRNSYHGDTLGAMAVGEPEGFHFPFRKLLPQVDFLDLSPGAAQTSLEKLRARLAEYPDQYAGFIFEPLIQGAAGMLPVRAEDLDQAMEICRKYQILTIGDEVFTGFYRTGKAFAFEYLKKAPDLLCLSKGITGGFLPLAVTLTTEAVFSAFFSSDPRTAFLHGHSYTANPLACAAGLASWALLEESECQTRIQTIVRHTRDHIRRLADHPRVKDARCLGTIGAIELQGEETYLDRKPSALSELSLRARKRGVLLRPLGRVLYSVPPYCVTDTELDLIYRTMGEIIE